jgi:hypothetical protein
MRRYRLFLLGDDGKITEEREFQSTDDGSAIKLANGLRDGRPAELWATHHRIAHLGSQSR